MRTFRVVGYAFVPVEIDIRVDALSESEAKQKARDVFAKEKSFCIVAGSHDDGSVHSFEPSQAIPL